MSLVDILILVGLGVVIAYFIVRRIIVEKGEHFEDRDN